MEIYIDTREQNPLEFSSDNIDKIITTTLPYGDYACEFSGTKIPFIFERKSIGDLFRTLNHKRVKIKKEGKVVEDTPYDRFKREIAKAKSDGITLILIIEKSLTNIIKGYKYSKIPGIAVVRKMFGLLVKHEVQFVCCKNREEMATYITEFFYSHGKHIKNHAKRTLKEKQVI